MIELNTLLPDAAINYTPTDPDTLAGHFEGIDDALGSAGSVDSVNGATGTVVLDGTDIESTHTAVNYTAADETIDAHLAGIDTALGSSGVKFGILTRGVSQVFTSNISNLVQFNIAPAGSTITTNSSTYRITVDTTAFYDINVILPLKNWVVSDTGLISVVKNGTNTISEKEVTIYAESQEIMLATCVYLTSSDYLEVYFKPTSSNSIATYVPVQSAPTFVQFATSGTNFSATKTATFSPATSVGNLLLGFTAGTDYVPSISSSGWTQLNTVITANHYMVVYYKISTGDTTFVATSGAQSGTIFAIELAGSFSTGNFNAGSNNTPGTASTYTLPSFSVTSDNTLIVRAIGLLTSGANYPAFSGYTFGGGVANNGGGVWVGYKTRTTAGTEGSVADSNAITDVGSVWLPYSIAVATAPPATNPRPALFTVKKVS